MALKRILILGGTGDAAELAAKAAQLPAVEVISSLAGRTRPPGVTDPTRRVGGFGGVSGLVHYLQEYKIDLLIDATHPYANQISWHGAIAANQVGIPRLMMIRPAWKPVPETEGERGDRWINVSDYQEAARALPPFATRVFLSIGKQDLAAFIPLTTIWFLMRMIEPPAVNTPLPAGDVILARGPFTLAEERTLLQTYCIDAIVSKNSGGAATYAKIVAARELAIPVLMIQRPPVPPGEQVAEVEQAMHWIKNHGK